MGSGSRQLPSPETQGVTDAGIGFGPETADKLFDAFYTTKSDGMGTGLSVSRSIIEARRGRSPMTGAIFSLQQAS